MFLIILHFFTISSAIAREINYSFTIQRAPGNPDGYPRSVIAVLDSSIPLGTDNNQRPFPGPMIRGKKGDTIVLRILNNIAAESIAVHFHGLFQKNNAWMDGSGGITQPNITPMTTFTYKFNLTQTGTYWYHSHAGHQYLDGLLGPLVIDYPDGEVDPVKEAFYYSADYTITLQEWFHERADDLYLNYRGPYNAFRYPDGQRFVPNFPYHASSVLINGRGKFPCHYNNSCVNFFPDACVDSSECVEARPPFFGLCDRNGHPQDEFKCIGESIRIRLIHTGIMASLEFWIDQHQLTVVARDGVEVVPVTFDTVRLIVGQRLDLIVKCSAPREKNYFIFTRIDDESIQPEVWSSALLTYDNSNEVAMPTQWPHQLVFQDPSHTTFEYQLKPLVPVMAPPANRRFVIQFNEPFSKNNGQPLEEAIVNNITFIMPMVPVLQDVYLGRPPNSSVADEGVGPAGNIRRTNILAMEYGEVVEIVHVSLEDDNHPWHIHGYNMQFIETGTLDVNNDYVYGGVDDCGDPIIVAVKDEVLARVGPGLQNTAPVLTIGDVYYTNGYSYSIFRLILDNPGPWFFHCHINWHMEIGMGILLSVEKDGKYPGLVAPLDDFPAYNVPLRSFAKGTNSYHH